MNSFCNAKSITNREFISKKTLHFYDYEQNIIGILVIHDIPSMKLILSYTMLYSYTVISMLSYTVISMKSILSYTNS